MAEISSIKKKSSAHQNIVLIGGGHAHALLIRLWALDPIPGLSLTLVSPTPMTPYSGMLPGLIAGHYRVDEMHIDLVRLCEWASVHFIIAEVTAIDHELKQLTLSGYPELSYDVVSIDIGSTPDHETPGVQQHAIPIKPIADFWLHWNRAVKTLQTSEDTTTISVVGGGAGAVESILAMAWACLNDPKIMIQPSFQLVFQGQTILTGYPAKVRKAAERACKKMNIRLFSDFSVREVFGETLAGEQGAFLSSQFTFWCVQASAAHWPAESGLACNEQGFIEVNEFLQSSSHPCVFASGDIAEMTKNPRPKAGVYAVRQAPVLFNNLRNFASGRTLQAYIPQDNFLSLLALGEKKAAGSKGLFAVSGAWVWQLKNKIDKAFMRQFKDMPGKDGMK